MEAARTELTFKLDSDSCFSSDQALQVQGQDFAEQELFRSWISFVPSYLDEFLSALLPISTTFM